MTRAILVGVALLAAVDPGVRPTPFATAGRFGEQNVGRAGRAPDVRVGFARPGGGFSIATVPLETYVARVLAGEAARDSPPAALEALAITIRTFAAANRARHRADGFDLCDQTHCQVVGAATPATTHAAEATAGRLLLLRDGTPASVYYTASCGGRTEVPSAVWPGADDPPFLPSHGDDACRGAPAWTAEIGDGDLWRALRAAGFRGDRLGDVRIVARTGSGRVARLKIEGVRPDEISGQDLRLAVGRTLGWQYIKSTAFELRRERQAYRFTGRGSGHGVGLCVIGSARLAEQGRTAETILSQYFPGLAVSPVSEMTRSAGRGAETSPDSATAPGVTVSLPDGEEGERAAIVRLAMRAQDELATTLGLPAPLTVSLRFHATTDEYERAAGQPWFTAGAVVRGELHLLPLTALRARGLLELTIRRALVRLLTAPALGSRPAWVREGAVLYFGGEAGRPGGLEAPQVSRPKPGSSCPSDAELLHPVSAGALATAYARARACFAQQMASGRRWRDVG